MPTRSLLLVACILSGSLTALADTVVRSTRFHLRSGAEREWREFPLKAQGPSGLISFQSQVNSQEKALIVRQKDVKAQWTAELNGGALGALIEDERDMIRVFAVPPGTLRNGANTLVFGTKETRFSDDIEIRDIHLVDETVADLLQHATVDVAVTAPGGSMPVRITVVNDDGSLVPFTPLRRDGREAVRTGVLYTADGRTTIGLRAGAYRIYASRGFEYSAPFARVKVAKGAKTPVSLTIRREVSIPDHISCDTHVHTLELSGHGDASVDERLLTAAGEGLDVMVASEHNRFSDYSEPLQRNKLDRWVWSIRGSEVTTSLGHFNIFPVKEGSVHPDARHSDWSMLMESLQPSDRERVVVQNHPRDLHSKYRPFDPSHHLASLGENVAGRPFRATAMEVVNSGAMSSDPIQLVRDWLGLLTRGLQVAAVGASDTHTVDFVPVAQARTYIDVSDIGNWRSATSAVAARLNDGRNLVSYGLATGLRQTGKVQGGQVPVRVLVWGPSWSAADHITIYSNGTAVWDQRLKPSRKAGLKISVDVAVPVRSNDAALVAVATGPGVREPFWEVRKPYQPVSDEWSPIVLGVSQALWIDVDGNGTAEAPLHHARRLVDRHGTRVEALAPVLAAYDEAVAMHVLHLLRSRSTNTSEMDRAIEKVFTGSNPTLQRAYLRYSAEARAAGR